MLRVSRNRSGVAVSYTLKDAATNNIVMSYAAVQAAASFTQFDTAAFYLSKASASANYNLIIKNQDRSIIEGQRPWLLPPLSAHLALYIRPNDLPLIEYQKWMEELGIPQL